MNNFAEVVASQLKFNLQIDALLIEIVMVMSVQARAEALDSTFHETSRLLSGNQLTISIYEKIILPKLDPQKSNLVSWSYGSDIQVVALDRRHIWHAHSPIFRAL
jgi:hypothetical protein